MGQEPSEDRFEIFCMAPPGLETALQSELRELHWADAACVPGGVTFLGTWTDVMRANLLLRGATRVLARIAEFRVFHLAQLDKRARKVPWQTFFAQNIPIKVEVTCRKSKVYHAGAAKERIVRALREEANLTIKENGKLILRARIDDDLCTFSIDTSGAPLHQRGTKQAVGKAPLRETLAALLLRECAYTGDEPVLDPMCGSGTFLLEAAEIASGMAPGRMRPFSFEQLTTFDSTAWNNLKKDTQNIPPKENIRFFGSDRNAGAIANCKANAERAQVSDVCQFTCASISDLQRPDGPPGLIMVNPPYGARIGNKKLLYGLYATLGDVLMSRFSGWRMGMITTDGGLARSTGLPFDTISAPIPQGGLKVKLYRTKALP